MKKNVIPRKGVGTRKFEGITYYYVGRTLYYSKAKLVASELKDAGMGVAITRRKDVGYMLWATKPVNVPLMEVGIEALYNPVMTESILANRLIVPSLSTKPTKAKLSKWSSMPQLFDNITSTDRKEAMKRGIIY